MFQMVSYCPICLFSMIEKLLAERLEIVLKPRNVAANPFGFRRRESTTAILIMREWWSNQWINMSSPFYLTKGVFDQLWWLIICLLREGDCPRNLFLLITMNQERTMGLVSKHRVFSKCAMKVVCRNSYLAQVLEI